MALLELKPKFLLIFMKTFMIFVKKFLLKRETRDAIKAPREIRALVKALSLPTFDLCT